MKVRTVAAAAGLLAAAAPFTPIHAQATTAPTDSIQADAKFVRHVVGANELEVELGRLAQSHATNPMVKKFAERMVLDHQKLVKQWADMASNHGLTVKVALDSKQGKKLTRLQGVDRPSFDREYMITMIKAHTKDVEHLKAQADEAKSEPVRKLAAYELPIVQEHLLSARAAGKEVGVDSATVARSRSADKD